MRLGHSPKASLPGGRVLVRVALGVAYDGTEFHGFAAQPGQHTVAGVLASAIAQIFGTDDPRLTCAGRTDAGVHALAQVVQFDIDEVVLTRRLRSDLAGNTHVGVELPALARALSSLAGPAIDVWRSVIVSPDFDARHSALARRYRYDVGVGMRRDPLRRSSIWHIGSALNLSLLRLATDPLIGEHDFAAFCRRPPDRPTGPLTRVVHDARWHKATGEILRFEIEAGAFCHQMVRSIVGALVAVGQERLRPSDLVDLLRSGRRDGAPTLAPPHGLCLTTVRYPERLGGDWE